MSSFYVTDDVHMYNGCYIRHVPEYFMCRCTDTDSSNDVIAYDVEHGFEDSDSSLVKLIHTHIGLDAKITQKNALAAVRAWFAQLYANGDVFFEADADPNGVLLSILVRCHPRFGEKFADYFPISYELGKDQYGNWTITVHGRYEHIVYSDGDYIIVESQDIVDDFSWVKAVCNAIRILKGSDHVPVKHHKNRVIDALRKAIDDQIQQHRQEHKHMYGGKYIDDVSGEQLTPLGSHVDHYPVSFARLVDQWLEREGLSLCDVAVVSTVGDFGGTIMSNAAQMRSWWEYHKQYARLRIVSEQRNLTATRK